MSDELLRNGDLESIDRHIERENDPRERDFKGSHPKEGRIVQDSKGRRVMYDVVNGRPQIRWREGDKR